MELIRYIIILFTIVISQLINSLHYNEHHSVQITHKFPHHVSINLKLLTGENRQCSGSIIASKWILTSRRCVYNCERFTIYFNRLYINSSFDYFSISFNNSTIHQYPTEYDDLALIELPVILDYSSNVKPILLSNEETLTNKFAVMPGFSNINNMLTYGIFRVAPIDECKTSYANLFDEIFQICTHGWERTNHVLCKGNEGGGLIVGWPNNPRLIGIFTNPLNCLIGMPAIYLKVRKFSNWILQVTKIPDIFTTTPAPIPEIQRTTNKDESSIRTISTELITTTSEIKNDSLTTTVSPILQITTEEENLNTVPTSNIDNDNLTTTTEDFIDETTEFSTTNPPMTVVKNNKTQN